MCSVVQEQWSVVSGHRLPQVSVTAALSGVTRAPSASPATGSPNCHRLEQRELLDKAFAGLE